MLIFFANRSTPPTTPQRFHNAERERERQARILGSPENRHIPQHPPAPAPIPFGLPIPPAPPSQGNDPFIANVEYNGQNYNLTQGIAAQFAALLSMPQLRRNN